MDPRHRGMKFDPDLVNLRPNINVFQFVKVCIFIFTFVQDVKVTLSLKDHLFYLVVR